MKILSSSKKSELVCRCIAIFGVPVDSEFIYPSREAELKFARFKRGTKRKNYAQRSNMRETGSEEITDPSKAEIAASFQDRTSVPRATQSIGDLIDSMRVRNRLAVPELHKIPHDWTLGTLRFRRHPSPFPASHNFRRTHLEQSFHEVRRGEEKRGEPRVDDIRANLWRPIFCIAMHEIGACASNKTALPGDRPLIVLSLFILVSRILPALVILRRQFRIYDRVFL